jgi:hypothetical protein
MTDCSKAARRYVMGSKAKASMVVTIYLFTTDQNRFCIEKGVSCQQ